MGSSRLLDTVTRIKARNALLAASRPLELRAVRIDTLEPAVVQSATAKASTRRAKPRHPVAVRPSNVTSVLQGREADIARFHAGTLYEVDGLLGARVMEQGGVPGTGFAAWAPNALEVSVVGDFNNWDPSAHVLRKTDEFFEGFVPGAAAGQKYMFSVLGADGKRVLKADPLATQAVLRPDHQSVIKGKSDFRWTDQAWMAQRAAIDWKRHPVSAYEVHLPSYKRAADGGFLSYERLAKELVANVKDKGFNAVELMPPAEHPFDGSWGYQVTGYYAPTARHGEADGFKYLVNELHAHGVTVIMDFVPAHFPKDAHGLAKFDGTHLFEHSDPREGQHIDWKTYIFNYGRPEVRSFMMGAADYWLREMHVDGLRFDAIDSMLFRDYSRKEGKWVPEDPAFAKTVKTVDPEFHPHWDYRNIKFLQELNQMIHTRYPGVFTVAEASSSFPAFTKVPVEEGGLGFDFKWNMGWMHDTLDFIQTPTEYRPKDLYKLIKPLENPWKSSEDFVDSISHDEVVYGKKSLYGKMPGPEAEKFSTLRLLHSHQFAKAGHVLMFMGAEVGQRAEWDYQGQVEWERVGHPLVQGLSQTDRELNALYRNEPALHELQYAPGGQKVTQVDNTNGVLSFVRYAPKAKDEIVWVENFGNQVHGKYLVGVDQPGAWKEIYNSDSADLGGDDVGNRGTLIARPVGPHEKQFIPDAPYVLELTLPALGALALKPKS